MKAFIAVVASALRGAAMAGDVPPGVVAHDGTRIWVHGARTHAWAVVSAGAACSRAAFGGKYR
ncbi:hypothetical protein [Xanthomonas euroxanthea]|uniref:hypothetical protein n=1 Tax=Xanthomonas euroxanthea TaxID=2259622 RepID=UPI00160D521F|nr:hypothetical protein [Xanthomonas euroxanthea]MBB5768861.1 hypothetical protein [Xanthomonas euroxanthea]